MDRLVFWIYRALGNLLSKLSLENVCRIGAAFGVVAYHLGWPYRGMTLRNLAIAFPELSERERRRIARQHFRTLLANLFAGLKVTRLTADEVWAALDVEGMEPHTEAREQGRGALVILSHIGNWEMFAQSIPTTYGPGRSGSIYQKLGNPYIDAEVREGRARLGCMLFERKEGFTGAVKTLRTGGCVGVLVDQHAGDGGLWAPFFGRLASTTSLTATMALRTGCDLLAAAMYSDKPGRWKLKYEPVIPTEGRSVEELTAEINRVVERQIRRQPADWFWVHNRWKTPKPKFLLATYKRGVVETPEPLKPFRIVIRSSNWLGDALMSVPAVRAIKRGRPDAHVTILTPAKLADVWRELPEVDTVLEIQGREKVLQVSRKVRAGNFDAAVLFPNSVRVALEAWLAGVPRRVGYPGHRRTWLLNQVWREKKSKQARLHPPEHQVHHYLRLAEFIGADIDAEVQALKRRPVRRTADVFEVGNRPRIGVCPGAEYGPAKRWLPERFAEAIREFDAKQSSEWVIVGVAKDAPVAAEIENLAPGLCRNLVGATSLKELIEELKKCDVLLTNDTGTMHLAAFLNIPVVAVFGSTEPSLTGPLGKQHRVLRKHVECSPCFLRECPIDFRCMKAVETSEVVAALESLLLPHRTEQTTSVS